MKEYHIGQVLYVLLKGDTTIHPVLVVEELRKKTLQGVVTEYTVEIVTGKNGKRSTSTLSDLDAIVFENIGEAKSHLVNNATEAINRICNLAQATAEKWLTVHVPQSLQPEDDVSYEEDDKIVLENGVKARVILPPEFR